MDGPFGELARAAGGVDALLEMLGVHRTTLNRWAAGTREPDEAMRDQLRAIAKKLGVAHAF